MTTYMIQMPQGLLAEDRQVKLREAVKTAHAFITGAIWMSTRISISLTAALTKDGQTPDGDRLFVHGFVEKDPRRPVAELLRFAVRRAVANVTGLDTEGVIVCVCELPPARVGRDGQPRRGARRF